MKFTESVNADQNAELPGLLVLAEDLEQPVDLGLRRVSVVLEAHEPERMHGRSTVLAHDARIAEQRDPALPLLVQQLRPGDLGRRLLDDVGVVAHRVGVEVRGRTDDPARLRLAADRLSVLADPADDLLVARRPAAIRR